MRLQNFLDLYVAATTIIRIVCKQDKNLFFEGYVSEIEDYPDVANAAGELGLWLGSVYADDDVLVIVATY